MSKIVLPNSPVASQTCPSGRITSDKRENFILAKLPLETSFIRKPLYEMLIMVINNS
jgi:hypothetical protein